MTLLLTFLNSNIVLLEGRIVLIFFKKYNFKKPHLKEVEITIRRINTTF